MHNKANIYTLDNYDKVTRECADIFKMKHQKYGESWRVFRKMGLIDQILIKVLRIKSIEDGTKALVDDETIEDGLQAIYNYAIIAILEGERDNVIRTYMNTRSFIRKLMIRKNTDYGDAWKVIEPESITDLIHAKIERLKAQGGNDLDALMDIANYAAFRIIREEERAEKEAQSDKKGD